MSGGSSRSSSSASASSATRSAAASGNLRQQPANGAASPPECLYYFGETAASSPVQLCAAPKNITESLRSLRLRHCCERTALSALHNEALADVRAGGSDCVRRLRDLLEADALAERVTCELNDILVRYDCRQLYSIKHGCLDCKVSTNVCITLLIRWLWSSDVYSSGVLKSDMMWYIVAKRICCRRYCLIQISIFFFVFSFENNKTYFRATEFMFVEHIKCCSK